MTSSSDCIQLCYFSTYYSTLGIMDSVGGTRSGWSHTRRVHWHHRVRFLNLIDDDKCRCLCTLFLSTEFTLKRHHNFLFSTRAKQNNGCGCKDSAHNVCRGMIWPQGNLSSCCCLGLHICTCAIWSKDTQINVLLDSWLLVTALCQLSFAKALSNATRIEDVAGEKCLCLALCVAEFQSAETLCDWS